MKNLFCIILSFLNITLTIKAQNEGWHISTSQKDNYTGVVMANGRIGIRTSSQIFETEHIILNNVYDKHPYWGVSQILKGMNFANFEMYIDGEKITNENIHNWSQTLDMKRASFTTTFNFQNKAKITYTLYALRNLPYMGYIDFNIQAEKEINVEIIAKILVPKDFKNPKNSFKILEDAGKTMPILQSVAQSPFGKHTISTSGMFIWHNINSSDRQQRPQLKNSVKSDYENTLSFHQKILKNQNLNFAWVASECTTKDFIDPKSESERMAIFAFLNPKESLLERHKSLWNDLWQGDIIIEGDLQSQRDVRLALYHLYSFGRGDSDLSIAPMGLSVQEPYNGHIFWDAELWMYPPLLIFNQDIARSLVNYRYNHLKAAQKRAINYGYKGAMFPWESDDTGEEATPPYALTGAFEHHITADIGIAFWNYYRVTQNQKWLEEKGFPLLKEVADFWISRAVENTDGTYSINNVIGANEYAQNINNNAFTNGAVITVLQFAVKAAKKLEIPYNPKWEEVANQLQILQFDNGITKEHESYNGEIIKQADVNLLAFPLNVIKDKNQIIKDLKYYEPKISKEGPAMGKSILSVLYARLGDRENAYRLFKESYKPNEHPPFGALSEVTTSNLSYFATGAGGMLQSVLFGFGGLDFSEEGIIQRNPILPKQWKSLTIKGVGKDKKTFKISN